MMPNASVRCGLFRSMAITCAVIVTSSCAYSRHVDEDAACAQAPIVRGQSATWTARPSQDSLDYLVGRVVQIRGDSALGQALVIITTPHDSVRVETAMDGEFRARLRADTIVRLDVRRIGYQRIVIPSLRVRPESLLLVPLIAAPFDGPCSGFAVPVGRERF